MNKITKDGFIWLLVTDKAKEIFNSGLFELYRLYDDGSDAEGLIESMDDLNEALEQGMNIGIEVGFLELSQKTANWVCEVKAIDPDTNNEIDISIYKHDNGGMFGVDSSFIEQVAEESEMDETVCYVGDPFNYGCKVELFEN